MKPIIFLANILFVGLLLIVIQSNGLDEPDEQVKSARKKHAWPGFFDFKGFKDTYGRHYSSLVEEMNREKIYLKNLMKTYVSKAKYKSKKSSKFMAVNNLSDRRDAELDATLNDPKIVYNDLEDMVPDEQFEKKDKDAKSSWIANFKKKLTNAMTYIDERLDVMINNYGNMLNQIRVDMPKRRPDLPDEIFIDHRRSLCLNAVRQQDQCGSCSIFSTTALYEWAYCKMNAQKIRFSEQYVIDCGRRFSGIYGCNGNGPKDVAKFYRDYGFELLHEYAYEAKHNQCPFEKDSKLSQDEMGAIKLVDKRPAVKYVAFKEIEDYLRIAPVLLSVRMSDDAFLYGGGVDDGAGCEKKSGFHSMLIVGSGRQDGYEYWIFRNSYSSQWGENGYYRLRKNNNCYMLWANGLVLDTVDPKEPSFEELKNKVQPLALLSSSTAPEFIKFMENSHHDKSLIQGKRRKSTLGQLMNNGD